MKKIIYSMFLMLALTLLVSSSVVRNELDSAAVKTTLSGCFHDSDCPPTGEFQIPTCLGGEERYCLAWCTDHFSHNYYCCGGWESREGECF